MNRNRLAPKPTTGGSAMDMAGLMKYAIEQGASDIHIAVNQSPCFRIHGALTPLTDVPPLTSDQTQQLVLSLLNDEQAKTLNENLELDFSFGNGETSRFRVNAFIEKSGMGAALRVVPTTIPTMEEIGLPQVATDFTKFHNGLVLVTGPTGCGKSTTLAAMVNMINEERTGHIVTVEDPIEFIHPHKKCLVHQREIGQHTKTFAAALRSMLRQDPDVILVGEMRDLETIASAITIAETGHLVFGTLHTLDAAQTVDRMIDVFPPYQQQQIRTMLASALRGVICQQLLPRKDATGRVAAREILVVNDAVANQIRQGKAHQIYSAIQMGGAQGMVTMERSVNELFKAGVISQETAVGAVNDSSSLVSSGKGRE